VDADDLEDGLVGVRPVAPEVRRRAARRGAPGAAAPSSVATKRGGPPLELKAVGAAAVAAAVAVAVAAAWEEA